MHQNSTNPGAGYPDLLGPAGISVENSIEVTHLEIAGYRIKHSTVLWLLEPHIRAFYMQVHTANSNSRRGSQVRQGIPNVIVSGGRWRLSPEFQPPPPQHFCLPHKSRGLWEACTNGMYREKLLRKLLLNDDEMSWSFTNERTWRNVFIVSPCMFLE